MFMYYVQLAVKYNMFTEVICEDNIGVEQDKADSNYKGTNPENNLPKLHDALNQLELSRKLKRQKKQTDVCY